MTEMTAAAFREAAEQITRVMCPDTKDLDDAADLLLAAAEQREAHDRVMTKAAERLGQQEAAIDQLETEVTSVRTRNQTLVTQQDSLLADHQQRIYHRDQQIATLTAERDQARRKLAGSTDDVCRLVRDRDRVTAERDALRAHVDRLNTCTACAEVERHAVSLQAQMATLTAERDALRGENGLVEMLRDANRRLGAECDALKANREKRAEAAEAERDDARAELARAIATADELDTFVASRMRAVAERTER